MVEGGNVPTVSPLYDTLKLLIQLLRPFRPENAIKASAKGKAGASD
jgi:hypothetical protein